MESPASNLEGTFLALLAMAFHEGDFLIAIDCKEIRDSWGECDHPTRSGRKFFSDVQPRLRIVDDDIAWYHPRHVLDGQFDRLSSDDDQVVRRKRITIGFSTACCTSSGLTGTMKGLSANTSDTATSKPVRTANAVMC